MSYGEHIFERPKLLRWGYTIDQVVNYIIYNTLIRATGHWPAAVSIIKAIDTLKSHTSNAQIYPLHAHRDGHRYICMSAPISSRYVVISLVVFI